MILVNQLESVSKIIITDKNQKVEKNIELILPK